MKEVRYMISDAAKKINVEPHVLRYWEEELEVGIPRNEMGHRYYTEEDIARFRRVKELKEQGLYEIYEQSLINELLYFLLWYLESMKTFQAFSNCYRYIQSEVESEFKIMAYGKDFFFQMEQKFLRYLKKP